MIERRKHERYKAESLTGFKTKLAFMYKLLDDGIADGIEIHREGLSTILNISKGGCLIHCYSPLPPKTRLLIEMIPPAFPNDKITVTGIIVREASCESDGYCYGVQFVEYHGDSQKMLDKFFELLAA